MCINSHFYQPNRIASCVCVGGGVLKVSALPSVLCAGCNATTVSFYKYIHKFIILSRCVVLHHAFADEGVFVI